MAIISTPACSRARCSTRRRTRVRFPPSAVGGLKPWTPAKFYRLRRERRGATLDVQRRRVSIRCSAKRTRRSRRESRSQHRSQGQGGLAAARSALHGVQLEASRVSDRRRRRRRRCSTGSTRAGRASAIVSLADSVRVRARFACGRRGGGRSRRAISRIRRAMVAPLARTCGSRRAPSAASRARTLDVDSTPRRRRASRAMGDLALALASTTHARDATRCSTRPASSSKRRRRAS